MVGQFTVENIGQLYSSTLGPLPRHTSHQISQSFMVLSPGEDSRIR
jgi:hypothetical protein